jgi:hypothetical protein
MNTRFLVVLAVFLSVAPLLPAAQTDVETAVRSAREALAGPPDSRDAITKALVQALDASLSILPKTADSAESASRLESVKAAMKSGGLFSDKNREDLGFVFKRVSGGRAWEFPPEIAAVQPKEGIVLATKFAKELVESALAEWKAGRNDQAVLRLLSFVLLVVTPIRA